MQAVLAGLGLRRLENFELLFFGLRVPIEHRLEILVRLYFDLVVWLLRLHRDRGGATLNCARGNR